MKRRTPGRIPGQEGPGQEGFSWEDHVSWLVERHGTLAAVAQKLAELGGWKEDAGSIERALRRLRTRGQRDGGAWGTRVLAAFGVPEAAFARARWMGAYHSRFTDLPLPVCEDLLRQWDRPPLSEIATTFLAIAHATCALRRHDKVSAAAHLERARAASKRAPADARAELLLTEAFVASDASILSGMGSLLVGEMAADDRACLNARWLDQRAYALNQAGNHAAAEELHREIGDDAPPFALCRRENGLAYALHRMGRTREAITHAQSAIEHAGDGGHLRHRAMALSMLARVSGDEEPRRRALAIAKSLDDEALRLRFERH